MRKWFDTVMPIVFFIFSFHCNGNQSNFLFNHLSIEQRLPGASIHCVYQDHKGLMWFAIESVGLCKYDGNNFTVYERSLTDSNSLSNNFPLCIVEDSTGNLWIGTTEGLNEFDRKTGVFRRYLYSSNSENSIPNNYITDLHVDRYNNIWIATRKGISKYVKSEDKFYNLLIGEGTYTDGLPAMISTFYEDKSGNIWIGSYSSGLFMIDHETNLKHTSNTNDSLIIGKHWLPINQEYGKQRNYAVQQICEYDKNSLLIGKIDGLYLFNRETEIFTNYTIHVSPSLNHGTISSLHRDNTERIWVGYATEGLILIDLVNNKQNYFNANTYLPKGLRSNTIRDIYEDKTGLIWIATKFQGIHTYDKRQEIFNNHKYNAILNEKINKKFILSILEDSEHNIWIGTKYNGIFRFNPGNSDIKNYKSENSGDKYYINNDRVECIEEDAFGNLWAGTEDGICKLDKKDELFKTYNDYFIRCLKADKNGNLWIGTNSSGVFYYDKKIDKIHRYNSSKKWGFFLENTFGTRAISITSDSLLWIATFQNGLYKYNLVKDILTHYPGDPDDSTEIGGNMVRDVYEDNNKNIWIGTKSNGLYTYNIKTGAFTKIEKTEGLPPNTIYNILQDNDNNYWMGSHEGLLRINQKSGVYTLFNAVYGLKSDIIERNAKCKTSEGIMIFGGSEGLNVFDPENVHKIHYKAPIVISSAKVYDKVIAEDISEYTELSINYNEKYISIAFALAEYSDPSKTKYKYKLEKFDKEWIESGNRNYATYTALPPGEYVFKVLAANSDNQWLKEPLSLKLTVIGPIWRKPVFILGCIILLVIISIVIYLVRLRFIRRNEIKLKELVAIKTQDLLNLNRELEEHKLNLENIVKERTHDLEEARKKAVEGDQLKSVFLANMSHEIRTPLNAIIGLINLLIAEIPPAKENQNLGKMIETNAKALQQLINDIIDISKIEANQIKIHKEAFPLNTCIKNIAEIYLKQVDLYKEYMKIKIEIEIPEKEIFFVSDQIRLEQILKNLINNSLKFTQEGYITVGYNVIKKENEEDTIQFFVKDTGVGIPEKDLNKIFDRFKKSESRENILHGGTGLGLSISYNLVNLLGGNMWVESEVQKGSQFYFELPLEQEEDISLEELVKSVQNANEYNWENKKVLVVEDIETNYIVLKGILKKTKISITRVKDGLTAVNEITKKDGEIYNIVLMDINLPEMDGFEATKRIKGYNKSLPIIAQTAYAMDYEEKNILKSGFDDFIAKPIHEQMLLEKMARFLE